MTPDEPRAWTAAERALWSRLAAHDFEPGGHALTFTARLARDRGWTLAFARGAVAEYRRFCFLAAVVPAPVTPSEEVDEVWHQHLTHSRDYWTRWCRDALRTDLHHDPTAGGPVERSRFAAQYADTLALYERYFGPPPAAFWPGTARRFAAKPRFHTVDRDHAIVLRLPAALPRALARLRRLWAAALLFAVPDPAAALPANPLDWTAGPFLTLDAALILAAITGSWLVRTYVRFGPRARAADDLDAVRLAYLAGGPVRGANAVVVGFLHAGAATLAEDGRIAVRTAWAELPEALEPFRGCGSGLESRRDLLGHVTARLGPVRDDLAVRGLVLRPRAADAVRGAALALFGPVLLLSLGKLAVGLSRGKPVGILVMLTIVTALFALSAARRTFVRTGAGDRVLAGLMARHARAARAPTDAELVLAFALAGEGALAGTALAAYAPPPGAASSGGADGGSGDGGGGCGGGGCGGCGGGD